MQEIAVDIHPSRKAMRSRSKVQAQPGVSLARTPPQADMTMPVEAEQQRRLQCCVPCVLPLLSDHGRVLTTQLLRLQSGRQEAARASEARFGTVEAGGRQRSWWTRAGARHFVVESGALRPRRVGEGSSREP